MDYPVALGNPVPLKTTKLWILFQRNESFVLNTFPSSCSCCFSHHTASYTHFAGICQKFTYAEANSLFRIHLQQQQNLLFFYDITKRRRTTILLHYRSQFVKLVIHFEGFPPLTSLWTKTKSKRSTDPTEKRQFTIRKRYDQPAITGISFCSRKMSI